ncbi:hypothetical protein MRX96_054450 [Rhipicephalus microplus]
MISQISLKQRGWTRNRHHGKRPFYCNVSGSRDAVFFAHWAQSRRGRQARQKIRRRQVEEIVTSRRWAYWRRQFSSTVNVLVERRRFTLRRQLPNEPIREFVSNLRQLAKTCDFGDFLEAALRDRVVDGIRSTELRQKLLVKGSQLTLAEAVEMLQTYEQAAEGAAVYDQGSPQTDIVQHVFQGRGPDGDSTATSVRKCYRCGSTRHLANSQECKARGKRCSKCHKMGHFQAVCGMRREQNVRTVRNDGASEEGVLTVLAVRQVERRTLVVDVVVENEPLQLLVDTGSSVSILPDHVYRDKFANRFPLTAATATLRDFSQKKIPVLGWFTARVVRGKNSACLRFYVVPQGVALLGLDAVHQLQLNIIEDDPVEEVVAVVSSMITKSEETCGHESFLLANGTKWNASKLTVISKGRTGQAQALADAVTARRNASSGFSYDMDLHIGKMAQPQNPIVVNESEVGPSEDTQGSANHSDSAQTTVTEPILEVPDQQDTSRSQLATATAPSRTRPERTRRMPTRYQDYELT